MLTEQQQAQLDWEKTDGLLPGKTISWRHPAVPPKDEFLITSMIARPKMFVLLFMGIINKKGGT